MHEEDQEQSLSRRGVIGVASIVPLAALGAAPVAAAFPARQLRIIEAFVERLIPSDAQGPGAKECGVPTYVDRSFASALAAERPAFAVALDAIDALARARHNGAGFAELTVDRQDDVLTAMETNDAAGFLPDSRTFFYRFRQLALEGMFGDPFYGGNRNFAGWDLLRYPGPRMAVSAADQRLKEPIKPLRTSAHGRQGGARHGG